MEEESLRNSIHPGEIGTYSTSNENTPLQRDKVQDEGLRYIVITFAVSTVILTIALAVTVSQGGRKVGLRSDVASDRFVCSNIGNELFKSGGNAVDAAVAVTICLGVVLPHLTGIGGNGLILIYNQKLTEPVLCLDSWTPGRNALPKLLLALFSVHESHGKKQWRDIIEPSIKLAKEGFTVAESLVQSKEHISEFATKNLVSWLFSLTPGENITSPKIAETLEIIQRDGPDALYRGKLSSELKELYSNKLSDLSMNESPCLESTVEGYRLVTSGQGSGGPLLHSTASEANISRDFNISQLTDYFQGKGEISWPFPAGVVVSISDDEDIYVSIVSGLGPVLGSQILSANGYIFGANFLLPKSSALASIGSAFVASDAYTRCKKRIITGAVDVRDLLEVLPGLLWGAADLQTVVEGPRVRFSNHGLLSESNHAPSFPFPLPPAPIPYPTINVIEKFADSVLSYADSRSGNEVLFSCYGHRLFGKMNSDRDRGVRVFKAMKMQPKLYYMGSTQHSISLKWEIDGRTEGFVYRIEMKDKAYDAPPKLFYLMKSAERGDLKGLSAFLTERKDSAAIDAFDKNGETSLIKGVKKNDTRVVKRLLSAGASVNQGNYGVGRSPLVYACFLGHLEMAKLLLQAGADLHHSDCNKCVPLHVAADSDHLEILKLCLESGANPNVQDSVGWTPLMRAVVFDASEEIINEIIAKGADIKIKDRNGKTVLDLAKINKNTSLMNIFMNYQGQLSEKVENQNSLETVSFPIEIPMEDSVKEETEIIVPKCDEVEDRPMAEKMDGTKGISKSIISVFN